MAQAVLIQFRFPRKKVSMSAACRAYRKLYGYNNASFYGKYRTRVQGLLDKMPSIRYLNSTIVVRKEDEKKVLRLLKGAGAEVFKWMIAPSPNEAKRLGLK